MGADFQVSDSQWWVVCLCAQWCGTCRDYRAVFDHARSQYPQARFVWLDVEDQEDLVGDIDVETFPTLLIAKSEAVYFFGPLLPQMQVLVRVLDQLDSTLVEPITGVVAPEAKPLWRRIRLAYGG